MEVGKAILGHKTIGLQRCRIKGVLLYYDYYTIIVITIQ